ncbi:MAG: glycoside hydrolase family 2, partial [Candidatus Omnitrophica bacterium]|nr:glycoside hydrolase family 2 [Candidatus Omnitrophota bacterium]
RSNPHAVGYSLTGTVDQGMSGEGLFTTFRELKPGTVDAVFEGLAPVRWCLFAEPVNLYQGGEVRIEAVLANEDAIQPGNYPVSFEIFDHDNNLIWERHLDFTIPERDSGNEPPLALPALKESVRVDGPPGEYRFVASFDHGAAAAGGQTIFHVYSPLPLPLVRNEVTLWGEDPTLSDWLNDHGVKTRAFTPGEQTSREVILTTYPPATPITKETFQELLRHIARGSTAIFLVPDIFKKNSDLVGWLPLAQKGSLATLRGWLYHKDEWVKRHPIFEGLPTGMMDYSVYREVIPDVAWSGQVVPDEVVAGANDASLAYSSGLMLSVYRLGEGRFILNTLRIRENIGRDPVAEKLFANLLSYAAGEMDQPLADPPQDFEATLKNLGFGE